MLALAGPAAAALLLSLLVPLVSAGYGSNLAYRSPYTNEPALAIDVHRLRKRQQGSKGRGPQQVAPGALGPQKANNYLLYGDAAVDWRGACFPI